MEVRSNEKAKALAEHHGWSRAYADGYVDGEAARQSDGALSQFALVGFDDYSLGYRAGYFERRSTASKSTRKPYWRYTPTNGWVVRDPRSTAVACPECNSHAFRIPRRFADRVLSVVLPVRRYQCESHECRWEGNVAINPSSRIARIVANLKRPFRLRGRRPCPAGRDDG